jgi:hypothetical protein
MLWEIKNKSEVVIFMIIIIIILGQMVRIQVAIF